MSPRAALLALLLGAGAVQGGEPPLQARARSLVGADHGVLMVAADGTVLAAMNADRPYHPASVTKIATTLAMLERLGPAHRFDTRIAAGGPVRDGVVHGDLVVEAEGDPFLVDENALLVLRALQEAGVRAVAGDVRVQGPLLFDWRLDPAGRELRRALEAAGTPAAWATVRATWDGTAPAAAADLALRFIAARANGSAPVRALVVHRSPPLLRLLKALNCYSNNIFHPLSERIGGPAVVQEIARARVPAGRRPAVVIDDAAGLGTTNRLSPRAVVALLDALAARLAVERRTLTDVLPLAGVDPGTLRERLGGGAVVGKTGTIGSLGVSALAGRARTARWGDVTFAILHRGLPIVEAQRRQDALVRALLDEGSALAWPYRGDALPTFAEAEVRRVAP